MSANLAAMLFGVYRRGVLALLLLRPEESLHVREIARLTGKAPGTLLRREINPNVFPALEFRRKAAAGEAFVRRVLAEKKIFIIGGEDDLGKPAAHRKAQGARRR